MLKFAVYRTCYLNPTVVQVESETVTSKFLSLKSLSLKNNIRIATGIAKGIINLGR